MSASDCIPLEQVPHTTRLFREYAEAGTTLPAALREAYAQAPQSDAWMTRPLPGNHADVRAVAELVDEQNRRWGAGEATLANIAKLREGARAVVTGQQVSLFGGPLYSLLKAATAVQLAQQATERGVPTVPIFWLATEDHDFAEVNEANLLHGNEVVTLRLCDTPKEPVPVGAWPMGDCVSAILSQATETLAAMTFASSAADLLRESYAPGVTLADAFARMLLKVFAQYGLIVVDAAGHRFHALGRPVLTQAALKCTELHAALVARSQQLEANGYHAQVLVSEQSGLLFVIKEKTGARIALRRSGDGGFVIDGKQVNTERLLQVMEDAPERLSPNALLRPVMQDYLLPTAAYVGGPAEVAYFAQAQVLYEAILGTTTPILPRLSATLVTPKIRRLLQRYDLTVPQTWTSAEELAVRLGARAMPAEAKQNLQAAGGSLHQELESLVEYANSQDSGLGHSADVAANKMRYQMDRLRRMMAKFELRRETRLREHAETLTAYLHPKGGLQERKLAGVQFLAELGPGLVDRLVEEAADRCPGHKVIAL